MTVVTTVTLCISLGLPIGVCKAEAVDTLVVEEDLQHDIGIASQYARGVMEKVIAVRQAGRTAHDLPLRLPKVDGYIAVLEGRDIGKIYYLRPVGQLHWESFLAVDCAGKSDGGYEFMTRGGRIGQVWYPIIVEVDWETAVRWDTVGKGIVIEMLH